MRRLVFLGVWDLFQSLHLFSFIFRHDTFRYIACHHRNECSGGQACEGLKRHQGCADFL